MKKLAVLVSLSLMVVTSAHSGLNGYMRGLKAGANLYDTTEDNAIRNAHNRLALERQTYNYYGYPRAVRMPPPSQNVRFERLQRNVGNMTGKQYYLMKKEKFMQQNADFFADKTNRKLFSHFVGEIIDEKGAIEPDNIFLEALLRSMDYRNKKMR